MRCSTSSGGGVSLFERRPKRQVVVEIETPPLLPHSSAKLRRITTVMGENSGAWWWKNSKVFGEVEENGDDCSRSGWTRLLYGGETSRGWLVVGGEVVGGWKCLNRACV
ncbi:hypothetical protein STAS_11893 [Striga asiatica]|uniref:Uncharacterized protein n=1 Tax=Striga asiatica TaxID=4170 RepID=A0A5A7PTJ7_STRAF|nr:hypothetical protein STAS_11893 [Striga asiatica]